MMGHFPVFYNGSDLIQKPVVATQHDSLVLFQLPAQLDWIGSACFLATDEDHPPPLRTDLRETEATIGAQASRFPPVAVDVVAPLLDLVDPVSGFLGEFTVLQKHRRLWALEL